MNRPKDWGMRIPDALLTCVVFLGKQRQSGQLESVVWIGTGFLVKVPVKWDQVCVHLVTAKHCADAIKGQKFFARMNDTEGKAIVVEFDERTVWLGHPTESESVDVATCLFILPPNAKCGAVPVDMFLTDDAIKENDIGPGDEVFVTGLFSKLVGDSQNYPIVRTGNVALMPNEPLPDANIGQYRGPMDAYLVEVRSMGGLSGSPVFVWETKCLRWGKGEGSIPFSAPGQWFFMGLMHGHWNIHPSEHNRVDFQSSSKISESIALGISVVVPAKKILEVVNHPVFAKARNEAIATMKDAGTSAE